MLSEDCDNEMRKMDFQLQNQTLSYSFKAKHSTLIESEVNAL